MLNIDSLYKAVLASPETRRFLASARADKAVHTYIVEGEEGTPKEALARIAAMTIDCTDGNRENRPCFECSECRRIMNGTHEDLHICSTTKKLIPVEDIRNLIAELVSSPNSARCKIVIIEQADRMNDNGQNCLLKTLEEPHGDAAFFLVTENAESLLPTVRSRSRILHAPHFSDETVRRLLTEGFPEATRQQIDDAVSFCDGAVLLGERILADAAYGANIATARRLLKFTERGNAAGEVYELLNEHKADAVDLLNMCAQLLYAEERKTDRDFQSSATGKALRRMEAFMEATDSLLHYANFNLTIDELLIKINQ